MEIKREKYLNLLIAKKGNGLVKIVTGLRRSGKSYLLFRLYRDYLLKQGVPNDHIIAIVLDDIAMQRYWNPNELNDYIRNKIIQDGSPSYIFIDEIQLVKEVDNPFLPGSKIGFTDVLLGLNQIEDVDLYVTGSNSELLSKDILTRFRGRGDQIHVMPLSFCEFYDAYGGEKNAAWNEYLLFGGMPYTLQLKNATDKSFYLKNLFSETYVRDILERNNIRNDKGILDDLLNVISSSTGSLTNPAKLSNSFKSLKGISVDPLTISKYLDFFGDSFLIDVAKRFDVKGKKYIQTPLKYYFSDIGLRNARLNFSEIEETHIMENVLFNELKYRGFNVDVGVVESFYKDDGGKTQRKQLEIDFVCNRGNDRYYIQSAYALPDKEKRFQETRGFQLIRDAFPRIVVLRDSIVPRRDENGILYVGILDFLLNGTFTGD